VTEQVRQGTQQAVQQAQDAASQLTETARTQARSMASSQKDRAAQGINDLAGALRHSSDELRQSDSAPIAGVLDGVAGRVESAGTYLQTHDVDTLRRDAEDWARRNSGLFIGGAFLIGLAAARFLKSSSPASSYEGYEGYRARYGYPGDYSPRGGYGAGYDYGTQRSAGIADNSSYSYGHMAGNDDIVGSAPTVDRGYSTDLMSAAYAEPATTVEFELDDSTGVSDVTSGESH